MADPQRRDIERSVFPSGRFRGSQNCSHRERESREEELNLIVKPLKKSGKKKSLSGKKNNKLQGQ